MLIHSPLHATGFWRKINRILRESTPCKIKKKMKSAAVFLAVACLLLVYVQGRIDNLMLQITILLNATALLMYCVEYVDIPSLTNDVIDISLQEYQGSIPGGVCVRVLWLTQFVYNGLTRLNCILQVQLVRKWKLCKFNNY